MPTYDDDLDQFELDGQLLVQSQTDPDRFHAMEERFQRIEVTRGAGGEIAGWTLTAPGGTKAYYGAGFDSIVFRDPVAQTGRARWLLAILEDASGNQIHFRYDDQTDPGMPYPSTISYTWRGLPAQLVGESKEIHFVYEPLDDPVTTLVAGVEATLSQRVKEVNVSVDGQYVRRLWLRYSEDDGSYTTHRTRLVSSQLFGEDCQGTISSCTGLPETTYTYTDGTDAIPSGSAEANWLTGMTPPEAIEEVTGNDESRDLGWRVGDLDGNGFPDLVQIYEDEVSGNSVPVIRAYLNDGSGWSRDAAWEARLDEATFSNPKVVVNKTSTNVSGVTVSYSNAVTSHLYFAHRRDWHDTIEGSTWLAPVHARLVDVNGDGLADLVASFQTGAAEINCNPGCTTLPGLIVPVVFINSGDKDTGFSSHPPLIVSIPPFHSLFLREQNSGGHGLVGGNPVCVLTNPCKAGLGLFEGGAHLADVTGDGRLDVLASHGPSMPMATGLLEGAWENRGTSGFVALPGLSPPVDHVAHWAVSNTGDHVDTGVRYVDVNGDGLADLVKTAIDGQGLGGLGDHETSGVWLSEGDGWCDSTACPDADSYAPPVPFYDFDFPSTLLSNHVFYADLNADRLVDVLRSDGSTGTTNPRRAWLQDPGASGSRWVQDDRFKPPSVMAMETGPTSVNPFRPYRGRGVILGDFDGNGALDLARAFDNGGVNQNGFAAATGFSDLLADVDNGRGGTVTYTYESLPRQRDSALEGLAAGHAGTQGESLGDQPNHRESWPRLPVLVRTVAQGVGTGPFTTDFDYAGSRWDTRFRTWLGLRLVQITRDDGSFERRYRYQTHGRVGVVAASGVFESGATFPTRWAETTWEVVDATAVFGSDINAVPGTIFVGRRTQEQVYNVYGAATGAVRTVDYVYNDPYGYNFASQITITRPSGQIMVDRTQWLDFTGNNYVFGIPASETHSAAGVTYRDHTFEYAPGTALLTKLTQAVQTREAAPSTEPDAIEEWFYDGYGNLTQQIDRKGRSTFYCYDGDTALGAGSCPSSSTSTHALLAGVRDPLGGITATSRDAASGEIDSQVAFNGDTTTFGRDVYGRVGSVTFQPSGGSSQLLETRSYQDFAQRRVEVFRQVEAGSSEQVRTALYFDGLGNVVREVGPPPPGLSLPVGIARKVDYAGRVVRETLSRACYDLHCSTLTGNESPAVATERDALGRPTRRDRPSATGTATELLAYRRESRTQPAGLGTGNVFDAVLAMDANGNLTQRILDGDRLAFVDECANQVPGATDLTGVSCTGADETFYTWEPSGELAAIYDAEANYASARHRTVFRYDTLARRVELEDPNAGLQQTAYDDALNKVHIWNARGQETIFSYDALDRVETIDRPSGEKDVTIDYDDMLGSDGTWTRKRQTVAESGGAAPFSEGAYDAQYEYDDFGRVAREVWSFPADLPGESLVAEYEYDLLGRTRLVRYPDAAYEVRRDYDGAYLERICQVSASGSCIGQSFLRSASYSNRGLLETLDFAGGSIDFGHWGGNDSLSQIRFVAANGTEELDLRYGYNDVGNVIWANDHRDDKSDGIDADVWNIDYDARNRIVAWDWQGGSRAFAYDKLGNLTGRDSATANQVYGHTDKPHAITQGPGGTYSYDADGNMTYRGSADHHLLYDSANRLTCVGTTAGACDVAQFAYDLDGSRVRAVDSGGTRLRLRDLYEHDVTGGSGRSAVLLGGRRFAESTKANVGLRVARPLLPWRLAPPPWLGPAGGVSLLALLGLLAWRSGTLSHVTRRPLPAGASLALALTLVPYGVAAGPPGGGGRANRWYVPDHLGSGMLVVDAAGTVIHRRVFEPFGKVVAETSNPTEVSRTLFTDQALESEADLYDFDARWYDAEVGRFASPDPVIRDLGAPQSVNAFSYVENDPLNRIDPDGSVSVGIEGVALGVMFSVWFLGRTETPIRFCVGICGRGGPPGGPPTPQGPPAGVSVGNVSAVSGLGDLGGFSFESQSGVQYAKLELAPGSTPAFKKQVGDAITDLNKAGAAGVIADLEKEKGVVNLKEGSGHAMHYDPATKTIVWDPTSGLKVPGGVQSPAVGLVHEADHALGDLRGTLGATRGAEELRVIRGSEAGAARRLGQPVRGSHGGAGISPVRVGCPSCTR